MRRPGCLALACEAAMVRRMQTDGLGATMTDSVPVYERPSVWMTRRYIVALVLVAVLAASGLAVFLALAEAHERTLAVVNVSGRQRMLSQRIALYVERLANQQCGEDRSSCLLPLKTAIDEFERAHTSLTGGSPVQVVPGPTSQQVERLYFEGAPSLDTQAVTYVQTARRVLDSDLAQLTIDDPAVRHVIAQASGPLLLSLDMVVQQYQRDGEAALARLRSVETAVVVLTLLTLAIEGVLIFAPMVRRLQRQFDQIEAISADLQDANLGLEARVEDRTRDLDRARAEAEHANRSKSRFLAAAGHDMLQPLQAAEMFTGMMSDLVLPDKARRLLTDLGRTQRSLRYLVDSVLEVSRLEAGVVQPAIQAMPIGDIFEAVATELAPLALDKEIRLNIVPTDLVIDSDPRLLLRVLRNLAANAVRYTDQGGVVIGARRRGDQVLLQVVDSGPGIPEADIGRIFDEFVQVRRLGRDRGEGLGLGLAIVERLCRLLGHRVELVTQEGRGSRFSVVCQRSENSRVL